MKTEEISCYSAPGSVWDLVCLLWLSRIASLEICTYLRVGDTFFDFIAHACPKHNISGFP